MRAATLDFSSYSIGCTSARASPAWFAAPASNEWWWRDGAATTAPGASASAALVAVRKGMPKIMSSYAIGVDLGGTNLRIAAVDDGGKLLAKTALGTEVSRGREYVI